MTDDKDRAAPRLEEEDDGLAEEAAQGISKVMQAALDAAIGESERPGWALAGLLLAARSLRAALPLETSLTEEDLSHTLDFVRNMFVEEVKQGCVTLARRSIREHCTRATASEEQLRAVVRDAALCVENLSSSGDVEHPITMLVVLYAARQMVLAMLKHRHPDEYEQMYSIARSMENSIRPHAVEVMEIPLNTNMSKGGSA
jgi:hypothetical protein